MKQSDNVCVCEMFIVCLVVVFLIFFLCLLIVLSVFFHVVLFIFSVFLFSNIGNGILFKWNVRSSGKNFDNMNIVDSDTECQPQNPLCRILNVMHLVVNRNRAKLQLMPIGGGCTRLADPPCSNLKFKKHV